MDATKVVMPADRKIEIDGEMPAYTHFKSDVLYWLRLLGLLVGLDIIMGSEYRRNFMTNLAILCATMSPL